MTSRVNVLPHPRPSLLQIMVMRNTGVVLVGRFAINKNEKNVQSQLSLITYAIPTLSSHFYNSLDSQVAPPWRRRMIHGTSWISVKRFTPKGLLSCSSTDTAAALIVASPCFTLITSTSSFTGRRGLSRDVPRRKGDRRIAPYRSCVYIEHDNYEACIITPG